MTSSIDAVFSNQGHIDVMCDRVVNLLKANTQLTEWTNGRILRSPVYAAPEGLTPPFMLISAVDMQQTLMPSKTEELVVPIGVFIVWEDLRETIPEGGCSISTVIHKIKAVLFADPHLTVGSDYAAERLNKVLVLGLDGTDSAEDTVTMFADIRAEYRVKMNLLTQENFRC
jgi:hypothetical protein